ncbi:hypothetical protein K488DRAFT_90916 [Vararia minispora EC-137]|uniref:Uncharacterized protein n=1 Tax=Vararia minispora EC-137 TaxID=1314806 RepID=A0ACB8Q6U9_9AGAM|nr:hypothetical protein K488DRAFT_90916 [Vararia minispora EC-137]
MFPIACNSIGDVIALINLIHDITRALNDIRGSSAEYRDLMAELKVLNWVVKSALEHREHVDQNTQNELVQELLECATLVENAHATLKKFVVLEKRSEKQQTPRFRLASSWRKLEWFFKKGELRGLRDTIASHRSSLQLAMSVLAEADSGDLRASVAEVRNHVQSGFVSAQNATTHAKTVQDLTLAATNGIRNAMDYPCATIQDTRDTVGKIHIAMENVRTTVGDIHAAMEDARTAIDSTRAVTTDIGEGLTETIGSTRADIARVKDLLMDTLNTVKDIRSHMACTRATLKGGSWLR